LDPKKYIESGIIEDYVMGFVSEQERQEVQCLSKIYPEINDALSQAEDLMTTWGADLAVSPPEGLKDKIMANLGEQEAAPMAPPPLKVVSETKSEAPVRSINSGSSNTAGRGPIGWIAAAAAIILSLFLAYQWQDSLNFMRAMEEEILAQDEALEDLKKELQNTAADKEQYESLWAAVSEPGVRKIDLNAVSEDQPALATVYWNPEKQETFLYRDELPTEGDGQYQLWAIVKGKPVSAGLLSVDDNTIVLQDMAGFAEADAFAITLEPRGGSESPTLDQMVV
jgi:anti-sigma-K factor RskA